MTTWKWEFKTQGDDVPKFTLSETLTSQVVDRCEVDIPARETRGVVVNFLDECDQACIEFIGIQLVKDAPAPGGAQAQAAQPVAPVKRVLYQVDGQDPSIYNLLENAHFVMGRGFVRLMQPLPLKLTFWNERDNPVKIVIAVARNVSEDCDKPVPPPEGCTPQTTTTTTTTLPPGGAYGGGLNQPPWQQTTGAPGYGDPHGDPHGHPTPPPYGQQPPGDQGGGKPGNPTGGTGGQILPGPAR